MHCSRLTLHELRLKAALQFDDLAVHEGSRCADMGGPGRAFRVACGAEDLRRAWMDARPGDAQTPRTTASLSRLPALPLCRIHTLAEGRGVR